MPSMWNLWRGVNCQCSWILGIFEARQYDIHPLSNLLLCRSFHIIQLLQSQQDRYSLQWLHKQSFIECYLICLPARFKLHRNNYFHHRVCRVGVHVYDDIYILKRNHRCCKKMCQHDKILLLLLLQLLQTTRWSTTISEESLICWCSSNNCKFLPTTSISWCPCAFGKAICYPQTSFQRLLYSHPKGVYMCHRHECCLKTTLEYHFPCLGNLLVVAFLFATNHHCKEVLEKWIYQNCMDQMQGKDSFCTACNASVYSYVYIIVQVGTLRRSVWAGRVSDSSVYPRWIVFNIFLLEIINLK